MSVLAERTGPILPFPRGARFSALVLAGDPAVRAELVRRLERLGGQDVVAVATVAQARAVAASGAREIAVVEPVLEDGSGIGLLAELRVAGWGAGLVLTSHQSPFAVRAAIAMGAQAFVVTGRPHAGDHDGSSPAEEHRHTPLRGRFGATAGADGLSSREVQVLQQVAEGHSNKDIGDSLGLSALTVKSHLARIARKLGTGDRAAMVALALRAHVIA